MNSPRDHQINVLTNALNTTLKELFKRIDDLAIKIDLLANRPIEAPKLPVKLSSTDEKICQQLEFDKKQYLRRKEITEYLAIKPATLYRWIGKCLWVAPIKFAEKNWS